jgi:hypothetical protein
MRYSPAWLAVILACLCFFSLGAYAQTGIYATVSASNFNTPNVDWQYGTTLGLYHDFLHAPFVGVGLDARAQLLGSGTSKVYSGLAGLHVQIHPQVLPFKPYFEGLVGAGEVNVGQGSATIDETKLAYEGVAGVDWTILPRFDWRVVEYSYEGFPSLSASEISPRTLSTGIVFRVPFL